MRTASSFLGMMISTVAIIVGIVILGGDLKNFVNMPSIMLTVVPTLGSLIATYPISSLKAMPSHFKAVMNKPYNPEEYISIIVELAKFARTEGLLSLENKIKPDSDKFLQYGMRLVIDGADISYIKESLVSYLDGLEARHNEVIVIYEKGAAYAPAFGMCATVISLVNMLMNLDFSDPTAINSLGANMAAALITTFYGCMLANIFFLPMAGRLKMLHKRESFCKTLISDGILGIQQGDNPTMLQAMLEEQINLQSRPKVLGKGVAA